MKTGIIYTPSFLNHKVYPECPDRIKVCASYLIEHGIDKFIEPRNFNDSWIKQVHTPKYLSDLLTWGIIEGTHIDYQDAKLSVFGCLTAGEMLLAGELQNAFVLNRPPGHHAYANHGGGFCYLNNTAILCQYLNANGMEKIMIVDWDAHHGNGTESIFYEDSSVLFTSIHQSPLYPGTGKIGDTGQGQGEGYNINIPVPPCTGHDSYMQIFSEIIIPAGKKFKPDTIVISAGQDSLKCDLITDLSLCAASFHNMTRQLIEGVSPDIIGVLEGGYNLKTLPEAVYAIVTALMGTEYSGKIERVKEPDGINKLIQKVKNNHPQWF